MHAAIQLVVLWVLAFVTLCVSLVLLSVYYGLIGNDLTLRTVKQEAIIAGIASLIEAASVWVVASFIPTAARALFIPALVVALIYKVSHLEDWNRYDVLLFLMFQVVIGCSGAFCYFGHFQAAIIVVAVFAGFLAILGSFVRSL